MFFLFSLIQMSVDEKEKEKEKEITGRLGAGENKEGPFVFFLGLFFSLGIRERGCAAFGGARALAFERDLKAKMGRSGRVCDL